MGGGLNYATELVKDENPANPYCFYASKKNLQPNLSGLQCRWEDVHSPRGETVSLIVMAEGGPVESSATYRSVMETIRSIYGNDRMMHPVIPESLSVSLNPLKLLQEIRLKRLDRSLWSTLTLGVGTWLESLLGRILMRLELRAGGVHWGQYRQQVSAATDYRKFDDGLRMVIAGNTAQLEELIQYLETHERTQKLRYGIHVSDRALLTCLIFTFDDRHVHFVDGADGGYALAAKSLKEKGRGSKQ